MRKSTITWQGIRYAIGVGSIALSLGGASVMAQSAKIAGDSVEYVPAPAKKELAIGFRLADDLAVTSVQAAIDGKGEALPATWEAWEGDKAPACTWMIVVDTSNPARAKTVAIGVDFIRAFLTGLPKQDKVAVYTLARDLSEVVPIGSSSEDTAKSLAGIKPAGDASLSTLIYSNLRDGLVKLGGAKGTRKAVLLLTDGKDETPGVPAAQEIEKQKLIEAAKSAGIVIHSIGYAESAKDQVHFAALKEIAAQTDGLFFATSLANKEVPAGTLTQLRGVMHGAGTVRIDVSKLAEAAALTVTVKTAAGNVALLQVPREKVAEAIPPVVTPTPPAPTPADIAKKAEEDKKAADAKKAEEDKKAEEAKKAEDAKKAEELKKSEITKKAEATKKTEEAKKRMWIGVGSGVVLVILLAALLMVRSSRKRAAEKARLVEEARADQEARRAEAARRQAEETKKTEAPPLAWLEMCDAQQTRHPVRIPNLKIGRGQHNDLVLRNDSISGNHCVMDRNREGEWSITDLNSGNGVVLNGTQVKQASLRQGDTIELGELKMRFLLRA